MLVQNTVTGQLVIVATLFLREWYSRLVFLFAFPFIRCGAVLVYARNALVAVVRYDSGVLLAVHFGILEQLEVMGFAWREVRTNDLFVLLVDGQLAFGGMPFLLPGVVPSLSFFGRSTGDSEASTRITSISRSLLVSVFLPGK